VVPHHGHTSEFTGWRLMLAAVYYGGTKLEVEDVLEPYVGALCR
jgi:hypothetical protein